MELVIYSARQFGIKDMELKTVRVIAKTMHEEHLCVVALTSMERGTQFFPLASYFLV